MAANTTEIKPPKTTGQVFFEVFSLKGSDGKPTRYNDEQVAGDTDATQK